MHNIHMSSNSTKDRRTERGEEWHTEAQLNLHIVFTFNYDARHWYGY